MLRPRIVAADLSPRRLLVLGLVGAALAAPACRRHLSPEETAEAWARARTELTEGEHCFAGRPEYCLTDPAFVDGAVQPRLDELYGGEMPPRKVHVESVIRAAAIRYKRETMRPENIAKVEELVKERYHDPKVTETADVVSIDMGVVPGRLQGHPATLSLSVKTSEVMDRGEWTRSELERVLGGALSKYPDKKVVRVVVTVPSERGLAPVSYRYIRASKTLVISDPQQGARTTKRLAGEASLTDPSVSLRFFDLSPCEVAFLEPPADQDPPKLCPPDVTEGQAAAAPE